jgi:hypothetical protein
MIPLKFQVTGFKQVSWVALDGAAKKGNLKMKVSLQKLLKTNVERMSASRLVQKLLKKNVVIVFLRMC